MTKYPYDDVFLFRRVASGKAAAAHESKEKPGMHAARCHLIEGSRSRATGDRE